VQAAGIRPGDRLCSMRKMLDDGKFIRIVEVHSGFSAIVADRARATRADGSEATYDMVWSSSLTSSAIKGKPDIETVDTTQRCQIVEDVLEVTDKPMIYDGDTGGEKEIFHFTVRKLERLGVSAVVIEDKRGLKQNSLFGTERTQALEDIDEFCAKIKAGKNAQVTKEFMIFARLEALIAGLGEDEAMKRAHAYVRQGGADGIMIHSKEKDPAQIYSFLKRYRKEEPNVPIIVVPTTYNVATEAELEAAGANICIYANQLIRASYLAMLDAANKMLEAGRSKEVDGQILPTKEMITLIDDNSA
jgi:phosphoenolpyruvate mutase